MLASLTKLDLWTGKGSRILMLLLMWCPFCILQGEYHSVRGVLQYGMRNCCSAALVTDSTTSFLSEELRTWYRELSLSGQSTTVGAT